MDRNKIISALVLATAATAAISLLLASEKGRSVVKKLTDQKDSFKESTIENVVNFLFTMIDRLTSANADTKTRNSRQAIADKEKVPA